MITVLTFLIVLFTIAYFHVGYGLSKKMGNDDLSKTLYLFFWLPLFMAGIAGIDNKGKEK